MNSKIYQSYINDILPRITQNLPDKGESSENYGSTAVRDVECLQSLSRRIHFGKFVAEVKFQSEEAKMTELIKNRDYKGLEEAITNAAVAASVPINNTFNAPENAGCPVTLLLKYPKTNRHTMVIAHE